MKQRVLVVDDEEQILKFLTTALEASDYEVIHATTGRQALHLIATAAPDLIILDLGLPDMDGKEVLTKARGFSAKPVIVLSAREREVEKIEALDLGANDYVEKPFKIGELLARLRVASRLANHEQPKRTIFEADGLRVDLERRLVTRDGTPVKLTPKEYDLLAFLVHHAGRVATHRQILLSVWGPAHAQDTPYLRVFVGQLRAKIEAKPDSPSLILTEPGVGYRLSTDE
ncbi:response regulator transcription factor [Rhodoblastus acidophilus]|uniref:Response regulator transcription factor n=1 Tax=Candidatus Rhodoblastus alkanivorans TaxID=2954117 RepID=A0ABS9Z821_9HYPH|nr:response regulator transcription factor [Candidatus Rhodoblastus alkanivorans]MCI4678328.1 response regulator transcription factor [Candidatus Rhodoblastus alkanivorans]MCI4683586.1 response regulator transcription factor [Candidatus Rhodoblastus alkanivorans]MDI4640902.1 response regulator transcription factor [Rhodoblastus acidophilus]